MFVGGNTVNTLTATTSRKRPPSRNASAYFEDNRFAPQSNKSTVLNTLASDHYFSFLTTATVFFFFTEMRHIRLLSASTKRPPDMITYMYMYDYKKTIARTSRSQSSVRFLKALTKCADRL